jgi:hypothetical protein
MIIGQHIFPSAENEHTAIMFSFDVLFSTECIFLASVGCKTKAGEGFAKNLNSQLASDCQETDNYGLSVQ